MLDPKSPQALTTTNLFIITLVISAVILLLITGVVIYSAVRFRAKDDGEEPPQNFGFTPLEIGWTAGPLLIVTFLAILTVDGVGKALPDQTKQPDVIITGHQWWWEVRYPQSGVVTANEIHIPTGTKILAELDSEDVVHDFWIQQWGPKIDMNPGYKHYLWLESDTPGVYGGACAEYCGAEHAWMLLRGIAQTPNDYNAWLSSQSKPQSIPTSGSALQGWQVFSQKTCISCHAINGTTAKSDEGPDLTHIGSRQTLAAGRLTNTTDNLTKWLQDPQKLKPGAYMPNVQLNQQDLTALVAYLESLK
jgi:cytochrome c oxidase subunit II